MIVVQTMDLTPNTVYDALQVGTFTSNVIEGHPWQVENYELDGNVTGLEFLISVIDIAYFLQI